MGRTRALDFWDERLRVVGFFFCGSSDLYFYAASHGAKKKVVPYHDFL